MLHDHYCCWKPLLLATKFRLIRQDRINGSGQVNRRTQRCLARERCSHDRHGALADTGLTSVSYKTSTFTWWLAQNKKLTATATLCTVGNLPGFSIGLAYAF